MSYVLVSPGLLYDPIPHMSMMFKKYVLIFENALSCINEIKLSQLFLRQVLSIVILYSCMTKSKLIAPYMPSYPLPCLINC